uniref:NAD(+) kinase n=1 Tax=Diabrotica virgifera virgifera TaxID=50390 RepID=A0A6P7FNM7_DIAVI
MYTPTTLTKSIFSGLANSLNVLTKNFCNDAQPLKLEKALIVSKLSRYEFERTKHKGLSEKGLESLLRKRGSNYEKLVGFHHLHKEFEENLKNIILASGTEVEIVNRLNCTNEKVDNADIIIPIGGDGTFLMAASRVLDNKKPVIGFNSDPNRSEGYLCLPRKCSLSPEETIRKLKQVFMGETLSARVSHLKMRLNNSEQVTNLKCSGICISTGTGSTSWHLSINRISSQSISEVLRLLSINPNTGRDNLASALADTYNKNLIFRPDDNRMGYTIRDLISSGVWPNPKGIKPRGFASKIEVRSHCYDASLVVDGGFSFPFNDGALAVLEVLPEDALRTVLFTD